MALRSHEAQPAGNFVSDSNTSEHRRASFGVSLRRDSGTVCSDRVMKLRVFGCRHQVKVLAAIILSVSVHMVDVFASQEQPSDLLLDDVSVFGNVAVERHRMLWTPDLGVSVCPDESVRLRPGRVVAVDEEARITGISIRARNVLAFNGGLSSASATAEAVRWIPRWRRSARPSGAGALFRDLGIHLVAWDEVERRSPGCPLKGSTTPARTNRHIASIYQIGAV